MGRAREPKGRIPVRFRSRQYSLEERSEIEGPEPVFRAFFMEVEMQEQFMHRALQLARQGWGFTNPNPMVGAVIIREGAVIGQGYHRAAGQPHAEIEAITDAGRNARGTTMYVNLEPCTHWGKTPPCTDAIIDAGIDHVVTAMEDPNPQVSGRGIETLRRAGVKVTVGLLEERARKLNEAFVSYMTQDQPFVVVKSAMSLDGKIATRTGDSRWISGLPARTYVHYLRTGYDAVMVGINTVLKDDPRLTSRLGPFRKRDPTRIVVDSTARIPLEAKVLRSSEAPLILATTTQANQEKLELLRNSGVQVRVFPGPRVPLADLLRDLAKEKIISILVEGGGAINASLFMGGLVNKVLFFIAPKILGGRSAPSPVDGTGIAQVAEATELRNVTFKPFPPDMLMEGYPHYRKEATKTCSQA